MSSRRKGSNESKDMWLKVNQKSLMKFEGVFTRFCAFLLVPIYGYL